MELISRKQALSEGLTQYFTGKPCKFGHLSPRNASSSNCLECWRNGAKHKRRSDPDAFKALKAAEYERNKEAILAGQKRYRESNWAEIYTRRKSDPNYKAYMANYAKRYFKSSLVVSAKALANCRKRQTDKALRTPKWITKSELKAIAQLYVKAAELTRDTGIKHVVDHIIPLRGATVSGLHCLSNLQILTAEANRKKWNKYEDVTE